MEVKRDILWRVSLSYIVVAALCVAIMVKAFYIQQVEGKYWRNMNDSLHERLEPIEAERGTIYSADGEMLSTSIPQFDIYVDFGADGVREDGGKRFFSSLDSLSYDLSKLFKDRSADEYRRILKQGYTKNDRYYPLLKKVSFEDYQEMKKLPLIRLGKNKSGFIADVKNVRLNPYQLLAYRTIGLNRENSQNVGLEETYDSLLTGTTGKRLVRYIAGGISVPVDEDYQVEPENGKDIITNIDTRIQDITESALMNMMVKNEAQHGCAIVMEVKTGKIKAIANLGLRPGGGYWEDLNYAIIPTEPGSTFKLVTMLSMLEDKKISLNTMVNLEGGRWTINKQTVIDAEEYDRSSSNVTAKRAFELSSNVGLAKMAYGSYAATPSMFINHVKKLGFDSTTGVDLVGEGRPTVYSPGKPGWSANTLPWMAFGYNITVSPLHTAMLYNAIANNGTMVRPFLLSSVKKDGIVTKEVQPQVVREKICSDETLQQLKECLRGVCADSGSTAFKLFKGTPYKVAGKTGTALVADGKTKYSDEVFQSSFAGYFPADDPQYTCVVVIVNKPRAVVHWGASVAGPVFKEISDKLYAMYVNQPAPVQYASVTAKKDTAQYSYTGTQSELKEIMNTLNIPYADASGNAEWANVERQGGRPVVEAESVHDKQMPQLAGMSLKDAVYLCENMGLKVSIKGRGRVTEQSVAVGQTINKGTSVQLTLN
ncbi:MAG TPA: penicillin-binding protein [Chitinophagaceae bacterium]|nr:penicillin-binding protein [Chitinophagaceae bacterium]